MNNRILLGAIFVASCVVMTGSGLRAQSPADTKGWHGAEWGMTVDQVRTAIGLALETRPTDPATPCVAGIPSGPLLRTTTPVAVGALNATARLCFSAQGELSSVTLDFENQPNVAFKSIRDELKGKYGTPTSEDRKVLAGGNVIIETAKWVLPNTEIVCEFSDLRTSSGFYVGYARRLASVL